MTNYRMLCLQFYCDRNHMNVYLIKGNMHNYVQLGLDIYLEPLIPSLQGSLVPPN